MAASTSGACIKADMKTGVLVSSRTRAWYHIIKPQLPLMPTSGPACLSSAMASRNAARRVSS